MCGGRLQRHQGGAEALVRDARQPPAAHRQVAHAQTYRWWVKYFVLSTSVDDSSMCSWEGRGPGQAGAAAAQAGEPVQGAERGRQRGHHQDQAQEDQVRGRQEQDGLPVRGVGEQRVHGWVGEAN